MSTGKEIRTKIASIKNTQKITRAMELVAASKMRKAQERMAVSLPYSHKIREVIGHVANSSSEFRHPYLQVPEKVERVGYIVVSTDRGLCGGLNTNMFRTALLDMQAWHEKGVEIDLCLIGNKAASFFKRTGGSVVAQANRLGDEPSVRDLIGIVKVMLDAFDEGKLHKLFVVHNEFINTMNQNARIEQLLPLVVADGESKERHWDYIYEPEARDLLTTLLERYIETQVYQAVVDNIACEQAARMIAMKSATDNAAELIDELQLDYNKARQASITQELSEIIGGAAAV